MLTNGEYSDFEDLSALRDSAPVSDIQKNGTDSPSEGSIPEEQLKTARQSTADADI
ncbi:Uncharacterized protein dnm_081950 [Desulfonema magnum]|uniref:Uncharacterized protein n=1 Tax=Desulfonema magnum TaxID=45655 RepID=A0A975BUL5_9BACT|nr:Uncharacterized protein dnm_081950 [Desulfonema magnum]